MPFFILFVFLFVNFGSDLNIEILHLTTNQVGSVVGSVGVSGVRSWVAWVMGQWGRSVGSGLGRSVGSGLVSCILEIDMVNNLYGKTAANRI